ncbi:S-receptor-like serine/threonine-protein kinase protein [Dioscorea alata]|uniref:S-receptor-like serine/threonine-protein kinase protein n=1 Tax=Dioscorea alata TaxID=55571 RepID=A0ACB7UK94_DIOAL|nr:S-receptor-like serine/threonine-protein kinase protein [Dioscorea alata]
MMRRSIIMAQLLSQLVFLLAIFHYSIATDTLNPNQSLHDGQILVSAKETFALGFFSPGGSKNRYVGIWYNKLPRSQTTIVWVANRQSPLSDTNGSLELNGNGTLTINSMIFLPMPTVTLTNPVAQLLDDANFVIREANSSEFAWQSFDYPTDTLLSGMKLGWDLRTGLNRNLTAWRSNNDPSPGTYTLSMDLERIPQINLWSGSTKRWRSGPWTGITYSNIEEQPSFTGFRFGLVSNKDEVYHLYNTTGGKIVARTVLDRSGMVKLFAWVESAGMWNTFLYYPKSQCEEYSTCGPYSVCDINVFPICSCLHGFKRKSPQEWPLRDASSACERLTALDCKNRTDGFMTITIAALPETSNATLYSNISQDECRGRCLKNCSCTAYATANISGAGLGCVIWVTELIDMRMSSHATQDVFVRLAAVDLASIPSKFSKKRQAIAMVLITIFSVVAFIISLICFYSWRKKRMMHRAFVAYHQLQKDLSGDDELELAQLQWSTLMVATDNFAETNILGQGGFGLVYKGKLAEGRDIAVKRLSGDSAQGIDEFKNEVTFIARLQHRNLVRLLGYCIQGDEKILVYEYMPNGSLDAFLFDKEKRVLLDWKTRFHIIVGIARGLLYLHQDSRLRIIHRDLKASNILLDNEMNPKISDFGLARNFGEHEMMTKTKKVVGTYGYMAPEYALDGVFSVKSDVFSFGVLILEIISGQRNRVFLSKPHLYLLGKAWSLWNDGKAFDLLDPLIGNSCSLTQVMRCVNIGLLCVQEKPEDRPIMSSVIIMLGNDDAPLLEPKAPGFKAIFSTKLDLASNQTELHTFNVVTLTEPQTGR